MTDRSVSVRLGMMVRDYVSGASHAERATDALRRQMAGLERQASATGREVDAAGNRLQRSGRAANLTLLGTTAGLAGLAAAGGGIKTIAPTLALIGSTGAALPGILGGAAAAGATLKLTMLGVGDAVSEIFEADDPFARLSPNARKLVGEIRQLAPELTAMQQGFQDRGLAMAAVDLNRLATATLPALTRSGNMFADSWSDFTGEVVSFASDPRNVAVFEKVTASTDKFFDDITARVQPAGRAFATLVDSADPLVQALGDRGVQAIDRFTAAINRAKRNGSLEEFFEAGIDNVEALISISGDLLSIFGQVARAANDQSGSLTDSAASLRAYVASGEAAEDVVGVVNTLTTAYEGMSDVLGPLGALARDALADPGTTDSIRTMFQVLAAGSQVLADVAGFMIEVNNATGGVLFAAAGLALVIGRTTAAITVMTAAAGRGAAKLTALGAAGAVAGTGLQKAAAGAGKAFSALIALQLVDQVIGSFQTKLNPQVEAVGTGLVNFAKDGKLAGEAARVLGEDFSDLEVGFKFLADSDNTRRVWAKNLQGGLESIIPGLDGTATSLAKTEERVTAIDGALAGLVGSGQTQEAAMSFESLAEVLAVGGVSMDEFKAKFPQYAAALEVATGSSEGASAAMDTGSARAAALAGSFTSASIAGKDLASTFDLINGKSISAVQGQIALEAAYDTARDTIEKNGQAVRKGTNEIDLQNSKGRENMSVLIGIAENAKVAADAADKQAKETGKISNATPILQKARAEFVALATKATGSAAAARKLADQIFAIPDANIEVAAQTEQAMNEIESLGFKVVQLPDGSFKIEAKTDAAKDNMAEAKRRLNELNGLTSTMTVRVVSKNFIGPVAPGTIRRAEGGVAIPRQRGGVRAAADGLLQPEIAPPGTRYQWAEPETGGELFLPKRGINMQRGRELLEIAASWYNGTFIPMAKGGVRAAAAGLVNTERAPTPGGTRTTKLDYVESYISARNAVKSLSESLKENGRSFSFATKKGLDNRSAVIGVIKAAQESARTRYEETGSVRLANAEYDRHIASLRRTLAQQKVNARTIRSLTAMGGRPTYDVATRAPVNSERNVAFARAGIAAAEGIESLRDTLSLNRATASTGSPEGRENLGAILDFLGQAQAAAQSRYEQTKNSRLATTLYNTYVGQLRTALAGSGFTRAMIDSLINAYGKITLKANAAGGVYGDDGGAVALGAGRTLYKWREPGTGGEAFLPRYGDQQRGEDVLRIGAGWYGGTYVPRGASGGGGDVTINNNLTVNPLTANLSESQLSGIMRQMDARARVGRRK